ncbi:MAG: hypothetical protein QXH75_07955 [Sulfolobaceae archaeon]
MILYFKPSKKERDINIALEIVSELFTSEIGNILGLPIPKISLVRYNGLLGLLMDYFPEKANEKVSNIKEIKRSLAFEEWILNIDLKEEHVLAKDGKAFIIDHGHALSAWKPLYYISQLIDKRVTRFNLWAEETDFYEGIELINSLDFNIIKERLKDSFDQVLHSNLCSLFTRQIAEEYMNINMKILQKRLEFLNNAITKKFSFA